MRSWRGGLPIHRFHDVLLVATAQVRGHRLLTKRDAVFGAWAGPNWSPPERGPLDVVLLSLKTNTLAPIPGARLRLNGGMASSLGLHPAVRRHRHRRTIAPQTAGVDVKRWTPRALARSRPSPVAGADQLTLELGKSTAR